MELLAVEDPFLKASLEGFCWPFAKYNCCWTMLKDLLEKRKNNKNSQTEDVERAEPKRKPKSYLPKTCIFS
jgi:hypothetical protein